MNLELRYTSNQALQCSVIENVHGARITPRNVIQICQGMSKNFQEETVSQLDEGCI